jgi:hypothetical protein
VPAVLNQVGFVYALHFTTAIDRRAHLRHAADLHRLIAAVTGSER